MKIFILDEVKSLTDREHSQGGFVIIAENIESAKLGAASVLNEDGGWITKEEWAKAKVYDLVGQPAVDCWVFPDSGCC